VHGSSKSGPYSQWGLTVKETLGIPATRTVFCGVALGYADRAAAINTLRTAREPLDGFASFAGFQGSKL
jgi:hypothetical protein